MMKTKSLSLAFVAGLCALLTGCGSAKRDAEASVRDSLKDPDSARFGAFYYNKATKKGCVTVNAKNAMGGYTGDQQGYVVHTDKGWETTDIDDDSPDYCQRWADVEG